MTLIPNAPTGPWLIQEDEALEQKLSGYEVPQYGQGPGQIPKRPIKVYFRFPDREIVSARTYPHIAIDLITVQREESRDARAAGNIVRYPLEQATPTPNSSLVSDDLPLPWSLIYQLACYSRQPWHDRYMAAMMYQLFPGDFGFLDMTHFDQTVRRADFVSAVRRDMVDSNNNRVYRNIVTIAVSSQLYLYQVQNVMNVLEVKLATEYTVNGSPGEPELISA